MPLFRYKPKKRNAQASTGWTHGLAFKDDKTNWVIPLDSIHGVLVTGSKADDIGSRVVKALAQDSGEVMAIDFKGEGSTSLNANANAATATAIDLKEAEELLAKIKQDTLASLQEKLTETIDRRKTPLSGIVGSGKSGQDPVAPPLLVINGLKPRDLKGFAPEDHNPTDDADGGEVGIQARPDLDASIESIGASREALEELVDNDLMETVENAIKAARIDTVPAVVVRWSLVLRLTEAIQRMTPEELEDAGLRGIIVDGGRKLPVPEDPVVIRDVEALRFHDGEDLASWAERLEHDPVTAQAALALTQCDSRIGLPWDPVGGFEERQKVIRSLKTTVDAGRAGRERTLTPMQSLWADVATLMRLSRETGMKTVIVAEEPDLEALAEVMPSIEVRVVAGDLKPSDSWAAGVMNEGDITEYGSGDLQVVSLAKIGRFKTSLGTLRSPFMRSSYTMIDLI